MPLRYDMQVSDYMSAQGEDQTSVSAPAADSDMKPSSGVNACVRALVNGERGLLRALSGKARLSSHRKV